MLAVDFPQKNKRLGPPPNMTEDECYTVSAHDTGEAFITVWEPTIEDLERLSQGGKLYLMVHSKPSMPPVSLFTENPFVEPGQPDDNRYVIWSRIKSEGKEYKVFWRSEAAGYTADIFQAGRYTLDQCMEMKAMILTQEVRATGPLEHDSYAVEETLIEQLLGTRMSTVRH